MFSCYYREKPISSENEERKSVKFADGVRPGEGTSPSAGEDLPSPPPPPRKLPKEKRFKKKKKKKIKVIILKTREGLIPDNFSNCFSHNFINYWVNISFIFLSYLLYIYIFQFRNHNGMLIC